MAKIRRIYNGFDQAPSNKYELMLSKRIIFGQFTVGRRKSQPSRRPQCSYAHWPSACTASKVVSPISFSHRGDVAQACAACRGVRTHPRTCACMHADAPTGACSGVCPSGLVWHTPLMRACMRARSHLSLFLIGS